MKKYILMSALVTAAACALYAQVEPAAEKPESPVKVEKIVTAAAVDKKEPVDETAAFALGTPRVYTWTKITAETTPARIKHVYYAESKKVSEVELSVNSSPYRVWSSKAVWPGNWRVDVTDENGTVLASLDFSVSGEAAAQPAKAE